jgi:lycopene beta-cyclase
MNGRMIDMAIVGGGLAGGLIALAVHRAHPEMRLALFESGDVFGGNHRWSWFDSDLDAAGKDLLASYRQVDWNQGYEVRFPDIDRTLTSTYHSLASRDFDADLRRELPQETLRLLSPVADIAPDGVTLESGEHVPARVVIDCRNAVPSPHLRCG